MGMLLQRLGQGGDQLRVDTHSTECRCAARRTERGIATRQGFAEERRVVGEMLPLIFGQICFVVNRLNPANQLASTTIHALIWFDVQGLSPSYMQSTGHSSTQDLSITSPDHIGHGRSLGIGVLNGSG